MQIISVSLSLLIPIAYLGILVGSLATFSHLYRQRQFNAKLRLAPYFPPHQARNIYLSLMHLPDQDPSNATKVPDSVLRAALLNRAIEDIYRIMEIRTRKGPLNQLLQRGIVGDEMWQRLLRAEQELEVELKDVVAEANALATGWGQTIFQSASEMAQNRRLKESLTSIQATIPKEQAAWDKQREQSRLELEGEIEEEKAPRKTTPAASTSTQAPAQASEPTPTEAASTTTTVPSAEKMVKSLSSSDDGVIVDPPSTDAASGGGGAKNKKKKGKK